MIEYNKLLENNDNNIITINDTPINLGKAWFITSNGFLYNCGVNHSHESSPLDEVIEEGKDSIKAERKIDYSALYKDYIDIVYDKITDYSAYYDLIQKYFLTYLHFNKDYIPSQDDQLLIKNIILGILNAKLDIYRSFGRIQNYLTDKDKMLEDLKYITMSDYLVRFCGIHKVLSVRKKTICTSSLNIYEEFSDYIMKKWQIDFIPPLKINGKENKLVQVDEHLLWLRK